MYRINVYIPTTHLDIVKEAMFAAGAGRIGLYEACAWETLGKGQFRPLAGSSPHIGEHGKIEQVEEYKVEMVCETDCLPQVIKALRSSHPYEEPAFDVYQTVVLSELG